MCFAELNGNILTFALPATWQGTIQITFSGNCKKSATVQLGTNPPQTIDYCQHPSGKVMTLEGSGVAQTCVISTLYHPDVCTGAGTPTLPINNSSELNCQGGGTRSLGGWSFECPDGQNAVGISIVIEENTTGEG